jgi:hypothetical protein
MAKEYNFILYRSNTVNESDMVNYIKMNILAWAGHMVCINSHRALKKTFTTKPERVRSVARPKLRWEDGVNEDMKILRVRNCERMLPSTETNGHSFLSRPGPTKGCRGNDV